MICACVSNAEVQVAPLVPCARSSVQEARSELISAQLSLSVGCKRARRRPSRGCTVHRGPWIQHVLVSTHPSPPGPPRAARPVPPSRAWGDTHAGPHGMTALNKLKKQHENSWGVRLVSGSSTVEATHWPLRRSTPNGQPVSPLREVTLYVFGTRIACQRIFPQDSRGAPKMETCVPNGIIDPSAPITSWGRARNM